MEQLRRGKQLNTWQHCWLIA